MSQSGHPPYGSFVFYCPPPSMGVGTAAHPPSGMMVDTSQQGVRFPHPHPTTAFPHPAHSHSGHYPIPFPPQQPYSYSYPLPFMPGMIQPLPVPMYNPPVLPQPAMHHHPLMGYPLFNMMQQASQQQAQTSSSTFAAAPVDMRVVHPPAEIKVIIEEEKDEKKEEEKKPDEGQNETVGKGIKRTLAAIAEQSKIIAVPKVYQFSPQQLQVLEGAYQRVPNPTNGDLLALAAFVETDSKAIEHWYRMRKQRVPAKIAEPATVKKRRVKAPKLVAPKGWVDPSEKGRKSVEKASDSGCSASEYVDVVGEDDSGSESSQAVKAIINDGIFGTASSLPQNEE